MSHKILLIDDDPDDREMFCEAINEIAPEITCYLAADAPKALTKLHSGDFQLPDLIFLDINMPMVSGWDCLIHLKQHEVYHNIPVIMYSTSSNSSDVDKAKQLGATCFFTKRLSYSELQESLANLVRDLVRRQLPDCSSSGLQ
ncbi:response regulator [Segetibacter sp. 3557_3]|uniref:response regulator n=1 Tax=Segetibacter sp. 3557_3 TaxID=2547429 RepID=UPI0010584C3E|nr:response regulator [Segetibacter sp. 3557_3]TDH17791.1 response regulator [Segetibacter sp. 3557_3]